MSVTTFRVMPGTQRVLSQRLPVSERAANSNQQQWQRLFACLL